MSDRLLADCPYCKVPWIITMDMFDLCYCVKCRRAYRFRETLRRSMLQEIGQRVKDSAILRQGYGEPVTSLDFERDE